MPIDYGSNNVTTSGNVVVGNLKLETNTLSSSSGNIIIQPSGTGALQRDSGGNARGQYAVDWQTVRSSSAMIADGNYSVIGGGEDNAAYGNFSSVGNGRQNLALSKHSTVNGINNVAAQNVGRADNITSNTNTIALSGQVLEKFNNTTTGALQIRYLLSSDNEYHVSNHTFVSGTLSGTYGENLNIVLTPNVGTNFGIWYDVLVVNVAEDDFIGVGGGQTINGVSNIVTSPRSSIVNGNNNTISAYGSYENNTICGGRGNIIGNNSSNSTIGGGVHNKITSQYYPTFIGGGQYNTVSANYWSCLVAGRNNSVSANYGFIGGGSNNTCAGYSSNTISGGTLNTTGSSTYSSCCTVGGGNGNTASGNNSTVGGGNGNTASGINSTVGGGQSNASSGDFSTVGGGFGNTSSNYWSTVGGGQDNGSSGERSTVGGGQSNASSGDFSTVGGGSTNTSSGNYSTIPGGFRAIASRYGELSHAAGKFANDGDAQHSIFVLRGKTTNGSQTTTLGLDGTTTVPLTIASGSILSGTINIIGSISTGASIARYLRQFTIKNVGGTTSLVGSIITLGTDEASGTTISITADNTNDALSISVTRAANETWRWVAVVDAVSVAYGT